ncbi:MAG: hypothetical protein HQ474_08855 [Flammeovirgaceae bacterium]|jgi:hypothetical protein|nr:hypothetical protein [Flammeovirgaceae bacterium]|tara:strand:- start:8903 stop:9238 length:336 start_codon:yes stop_codon:yes gene_type:complete
MNVVNIHIYGVATKTLTLAKVLYIFLAITFVTGELIPKDDLIIVGGVEQSDIGFEESEEDNDGAIHQNNLNYSYSLLAVHRNQKLTDGCNRFYQHPFVNILTPPPKQRHQV